jgi:hypothetical protein
VSVRRALLALAATALLACGETGPLGTLALRVVDADGEVIPARIELLDAQGEPFVLPDAIPLTFQCVAAPPPDWADFLVRDTRIENPHTGTVQFYLAGPAEAALPAGDYVLRAFVGNEHRVAETGVRIEAEGRSEQVLVVERWVDMPARGWFSADDHLHITRRTPEDGRRIGRWLRAEDLHVGHLLQMGTIDQLSVTPQPGFGDAGVHREGDTLLVAGQEHPRTHVLGHTITLGADAVVDLRETYVLFDRFAAVAHERGGLFGFAHHGVGSGARDGLAVFGSSVDFLEVLQFEWPHYDVWYGLLDLGLRITPTAGTDFPCGMWSVPGRERFYTRIDGPVTRESWASGIRAGRTFVTNGPVLSFRIDDADIGGSVRLPGPGFVTLRARVQFDPERDEVTRVEVVRNGEMIPAPVARLGAGDRGIELRLPVDEPAWFALRVWGDKVGEAPAPAAYPEWMLDFYDGRLGNFREFVDAIEAYSSARGRVRPTAAHSAPIWVEVGGAPFDPARAAERAAAALERLAALEARLDDARIEDEALWDWLPYSDGVPVEHLRRNRPALLAAIAEARTRYEALAGDGATR